MATAELSTNAAGDGTRRTPVDGQRPESTLPMTRWRSAADPLDG